MIICIYQFYSCANLKIIFQNTCRIKSFFRYKDSLNLKDPKSFTKLVVGIVMIFYIGKTKRRLHDRKTKHFKSLTKIDRSSAIADHVTATRHNIIRNHFEILASGKTELFSCLPKVDHVVN